MKIFIAIVTLVVLFLAKLHSYNLFHILAEFYSVAIACAIFLFAWNTRWLLENRYLLIIGIAYLFVGAIDLVHTLAYKGMGIFPGYDANLPTQLWIGARYMQSLSLLIAPMFMKKRFNSGYVFLGCGAATALFLFSIFYWQNFPDCFIEGAGLTPFKVASEYAISAILLGSLYLLHKNKESFDQKVLKLITFSILVTVASEMSFTLYTDVYGIFNMLGHYLKILSFYLIYEAIIVTGLRKPYRLLLRDLGESEERFRTLVAQAPFGIAIVNTDQSYTYINPGFTALFGYTRKDLPDREAWLVKAFPNPDDREQARSFWETEIVGGLKTGEVKGNLTRITARDGKEKIINTHIVLVGGGQYIIAYIDITDLKHHQEALERALTELHEAKDRLIQSGRMVSLGQLADGAAHEINNPLHIMNLRIQLMELKEPLTESMKTSFGILKVQIDRIAEITNSLKTFSGLPLGEKKEVDMGAMIDHVLTVVGERTQADDTTIETSLPDGLPALKVDAGRMEQMLLHIVNNALDAVKEKDTRKVTISASLRDTEQGDRWLRITVSDTGCGIKEEDLPRIFDPFFTTKGPDRGTGLGLSIAYVIVQDHDGRIWAENNEQGGATFFIELPVGLRTLTKP